MLFSLASTVFGLVAFTQAVDHAVIVGGPDGVPAYHPASINAAIGDTVTFTFQQKNHTITQSSLANPCTPLEGGFDSGFQPVGPENTNGPFPAATIAIEDADPIWVYCRQKTPASHCAAGMVFAINPADDAQLAAFQAAAKATAENSTANSTASVTTNSTAASTAATATATSTSAAASATPTDHKVLVGDGGALAYSPSHITAQIGDTITFEFRTKNHTVSQSTFSEPCRLSSATTGQPGFDSGFMAVAAGSTSFATYTIKVNDTQPTWAYCRQTNPSSHCGSGMVFAVNALESGDKSFDAFVALAKQKNGTSGASNTTSSNNNGASVIGGQSALAWAALVIGAASIL